MDVDPAVRRHCARLDWQFCPVQCYHFGVRLLQGLVHVNATDVDDSDKQLPITYKLVAADGFAIDNRRSASITLASAPAIDCTFDLLYKLCTIPKHQTSGVTQNNKLCGRVANYHVQITVLF